VNSPCPRKLGNWRAAWRSNESSELMGNFIVHECIICGIVLYMIRSSDSCVAMFAQLYNCSVLQTACIHIAGGAQSSQKCERHLNILGAKR